MKMMLHRKCPKCAASGISLFGLSRALTGHPAVCGGCQRQFSLRSGFKLMTTFVAAIFVPLAILGIPFLGVVAATLGALFVVSAIYCLMLRFGRLTETKSIPRSRARN